MPRVFELYGDDVGREPPITGGDDAKGFVQNFCWASISDRGKQPPGRPAHGDRIGDNANAIAGLDTVGISGERHRP